MTRLAIVTTHPIQYNDPWFKLLAKDIQVKIFYTWEQTGKGPKFDPGFNRVIEWDIPMLQGYEYVFVRNASTEPGTHHFKGIKNPTLIQEIKDWHPTAVLVIGWSFQSHLQCIRFFHKKLPVLFRGDSTLLDEKREIKRIIRKFFLTWVYRHIDYALYVGQSNKEYYLRHGVAEKQLVFVPHAIDNDRFTGNTEESKKTVANWRKQLGIEESDCLVLFAGKLEPKKNPFFIIELAKLIKEKHIRFLVVGNGELEKAVKEKASGDTRFIFLEFQNQQLMPAVYKMGDIFILPSVGPGETWGLAVNEAMACEKPVIVSTKAGCAVDLVKENINGITIDPFDRQKCADLIIALSQDKKAMLEMGQHSKRIIRDYSFKNIVDSISNLLYKLKK